MQTTSQTYKNIVAAGGYQSIVRATISARDGTGAVVYQMNEMTECRVTGSMFSEDLSIGNCIARQLDITFWPKTAKIPRPAKIVLELAVTNGTQTSEYIPKGTFYSYDRSYDEVTGELSITAYDGFVKTSGTFADIVDPLDNWPVPMTDAVDYILDLMGDEEGVPMELDSRTVINTGADYAVPKNADYTVREVLSHIAAAHGGNWVITDANELRLVRLDEAVFVPGLLTDENGDPLVFPDGMRIVVEE